MQRSRGMIRLIAAFRIAKAVLIVAAALGVQRILFRPGAAAILRGWVAALPFAQAQHFLGRAVAGITTLPLRRIEAMEVGAFAYAALFTVEGVGLWMGRVWAEWLTVIATVSFIPFEIYEIVQKPSPLRIGVLVLNAAIVGYLVWRIRAGRRLSDQRS